MLPPSKADWVLAWTKNFLKKPAVRFWTFLKDFKESNLQSLLKEALSSRKSHVLNMNWEKSTKLWKVKSSEKKLLNQK